MKIIDVNAGYDRTVIVKNVALSIKKGEIISLIGPNGGGKSTLLKTISGELKMLGGTVMLGDEEITKIPLREIAKRMSILNTERVRPELMSAFDIVLSGRLPYNSALGVNSDADFDAARNACELMHVSDLCEIPFSSLSDGQKQRVLIARAICQEPEYLLMDEPTSYLDIRHRWELLDVVRTLSDRGVTVVMSLHEIELALAVSDRVLLVKEDGTTLCQTPDRIMESGVIKELYSLTDAMYEKVMGHLQTPGPVCGSAHERRSGSASQTNATRDLGGSAFYFENRDCAYFPCHEGLKDAFNCLFCYCPLYPYEDCGGTYTYNEKGIKNCKDCTFVHEKKHYGDVVKKLKEKMYGSGGVGKV